MALPLREGTGEGRSGWAPITIGLIVANVVVLLFLAPSAMQRRSEAYEVTTERPGVATYLARWGTTPCELDIGEPLTADTADECSGEAPDEQARLDGDKSVLLSLLTALFVHGNLLHLVGNMVFLAVFGPAVERRLGPLAFSILYLGAGLLGTATHAAFHLEDATPMVGASGAIAGIMGAYLVLWPRGRILAAAGGVALQLVWVPAWLLLGLFVVTQLVLPDTEVAWLAHLGGMAAGALAVLPVRLGLLEWLGFRTA